MQRGHGKKISNWRIAIYETNFDEVLPWVLMMDQMMF
jgi:hypothetical protein